MITLAPALVLTNPPPRTRHDNDDEDHHYNHSEGLSNYMDMTPIAKPRISALPTTTPTTMASSTPLRKLTIDTDLANLDTSLTGLGVLKDDEDDELDLEVGMRMGSGSSPGSGSGSGSGEMSSVGGLGGLKGGVGVEMKDWLARSNPSSPISSPIGPTKPIDLDSYLSSPPPVLPRSVVGGGAEGSTRRHEAYSPVISAPIKKVKKRGSGWNLRSTGGAGAAGGAQTGGSGGLTGFVNRLRSRSHHNLRAEAGSKVRPAEVVPPLPCPVSRPMNKAGDYVSRAVPLAANFDRGQCDPVGLQPGPNGGSRSVSPGLGFPSSSPYRDRDHHQHQQHAEISLGRPISSSDDLTTIGGYVGGERSRSGSAAPSSLTYTSASSSSEWSSRFPTPSATPALTDVRIEVDPFDLTSPMTEMFNFSEMGFLGGRDQVGGRGSGSGSSPGGKDCGRSGTVKASKKLGSARSLKDLRSVASGFFGNGHGPGDDHHPARSSSAIPGPGPSSQGGEKRGVLEPSATLRNKRSVPRFGPGVGAGAGDKSIQKRTSLSWLRDTLGRRHERDPEGAGFTSPGEASRSRNDGKEDVGEAGRLEDVTATPVQSLMVPTQRNKARPALTITLPSSASLSAAREAIPLSLSDEQGEVLGQGNPDDQSSPLPSKPSTSGSFSDLYAELGISPPGESDEEEMPYSPRVERPVDFFSFGDLMDSLGGPGPIELGQPATTKKNSMIVGRGSGSGPGSASCGNSMVGSGRNTNRSSWRSSRHSIKPASAPPTAALPPLPTLAHLQTPDKKDFEVRPQETCPLKANDAPRVDLGGLNETTVPLSPRPVDLSSGRSSAIELGFSTFQHIRSWDEIKEVDPQSRPESNGTDGTLGMGAGELDKTLDYAFLDDYHGSEDGEEFHDAQMGQGDSCPTMTASSSGQKTCASGSQTGGVSASTSSEQAGTGSGYTESQILPRGRTTEEASRRAGSNRSRSGSRTPPKAPRRAGSPVSEDAVDSSSDVDSDSDDTDGRASGISDDDVPLAQRIPGALKAQKSLRWENRRSRRASKYPGLGITSGPKRTRRLDGGDNPKWQGEGGVPARDLERKLQQLLERPANPSPNAEPSEVLQSRSTSVRVPRPPAPSHQNSLRNIGQAAAGMSGVSRQTSINRSSSRMTSHRSVDASPVLGGSPFAPSSRVISRSNTPALTSTTSNGRLVSGSSQLKQQRNEAGTPSQEWLVSRSGSLRHPGPPAAKSDQQLVSPTGQSSRSISWKPSLAVNNDDNGVPRNPSVPLPSLPPLTTSGHIPMASTPPAATRQRQVSGDRGMPLALAAPPTVIQQAIYLESSQGARKMIDLTVNTTADEVLKQITGGRPSESFMGDWVLFEVFGEYFNMERPIRGFESLVTIMKGWGKDSGKNAFVAKISPLDRLTRTEMMPRVSPMHGVYVQHETKRGKWNKRWIELRNGNVFLAKNDRGKDSDFLCSSSAFDPYILHGNGYKGPKPFVVVLKSREPATLFESPDDYLHVFALDSAAGIKLMEALFTAKSAATLPTFSSGGVAASHANHTVTSPVERKPSSPLIDLKSTGVFTGGSLLSKLAGRK